MNTPNLPPAIEWAQRHRNKIYKKYFKKGIPIFVIRQRTCSTALMIVDEMKKVSFDELSINLYLICGDSAFQDFSKAYESMLELAKLDPDKFVEQLYPFYDKMTKKIKQEKMLPMFFDFLVFFQEQLISGKAENLPVFSAYVDILLGQTEFLRKDKFDYNMVLSGITTAGEPIEFQDAFPSLDLASYIVEMDLLENGRKNNGYNLQRMIEKTYQYYGYPQVRDLDDTEALRLASKFHQNNLDNIAAYINEYTTDILPTVMHPPLYEPSRWPKVKRETAALRDLLTKRRRTLPANGYIIKLTGSKQFREVLMKEVYHNGQIVLLYKIKAEIGDLSGWYQTKTKLFYGPFPYQQSYGKLINDCLEAVVLWGYAAYVCNADGITQDKASYLAFVKDNPNVNLTFSGIPGKLRQTYQQKDIHHPITTSEAYETTIRSIAGYIRRLPAGQHPSEKAVKLAADLGLELEGNETYVQPFMRACWVVKKVSSN